MNYNHLEEINEIIALLRVENLDEAASNLKRIMDYTFSGTELIMAVKFNLLQISKDKLTPSTQNRISNLIEYINKLLS